MPLRHYAAMPPAAAATMPRDTPFSPSPRDGEDEPFAIIKILYTTDDMKRWFARCQARARGHTRHHVAMSQL